MNTPVAYEPTGQLEDVEAFVYTRSALDIVGQDSAEKDGGRAKGERF